MYDETNRDTNPRARRQLAAVSGGRAYFPRELDDLDGVWRDVAGAIRSQYTIGYDSTNSARDGQFRRVTIAASPASRVRGLRIATREGYYAPSADGVTR
jgi:Ca-activated chloride channel family protein